MYIEDIYLLYCPKCKSNFDYITENNSLETDHEIISGELICKKCDSIYKITNGIPRFIEDTSYNPTWNFKWTELDKGNAYNYQIIEDGSLSHSIHDIFDRNSHGKRAWNAAKGKLILDIGCGIGQYSVKLMRDYSPAKIIAMDLTEGVDVFRKILQEHYPNMVKKIIIVQASVFNMPFKDAQFDYIFSLGALHHTGDTKKAINCACACLKNKGQINFWVYSNCSVAYENPTRNSWQELKNTLHSILYINGLIKLFRKMPHDLVLKILRCFSSDFWYRQSLKACWGEWVARIFPIVQHPDFGYRLINMYDGYCNTFAETWDEYELTPIMQEHNIIILGLSDWRIGIWGKKDTEFFQALTEQSTS